VARGGNGAACSAARPRGVTGASGRFRLPLSAPAWTFAAPAAALAVLLLFGLHGSGTLLDTALRFGVLFPVVLAAVHHAEVIALKVGEPFGTLVLALSVTVIEGSLIVTLMLANPEATATLVRDTVYAAVMIILAGVVGLCITFGAARHYVQSFGLYGVSAANATLATLAVLVLVLPNFTTTTRGPTFSDAQTLVIAAAALLLYILFVFILTIRHRDYFLPASEAEPHADYAVSGTQAVLAFGLLFASLVLVVLVAESLSTPLTRLIVDVGAPASALGVIIASIVLLPESLAALRAARANRLQTSLNLALGSALATIGLTVPLVLFLAVVLGWNIVLGLAPKDITLLLLILLVASMSLGTGRTTVLQGAVHLVIFLVFLFTAFSP
jgi:Ca2+:H+ antiporter